MSRFKQPNALSLPVLKILFSVGFLFLAPSQGVAGLSCAQVFEVTAPAAKPALDFDGVFDNQYGQLRSEFRHNSKYEVALSDSSAIKEQCGLGTCHLHSWISSLERSYEQKYHKNIKLSTHYVSAIHWYSESLDALETKNKKIEVSLGATAMASRKKILNYGLVPDSVWEGSRNFHENPTADRVQEYVRNIVARAKWERDREVDSEKRAQILKNAQAQIHEMFGKLFRDIPTSFVYDGRSYTPQSFASEFFPELRKRTVQMQVSLEADGKTRFQDPNSQTLIETQVEVLESTARSLLDRGHSVYLAYNHNRHFVDKKTGIMSTSAFYISKDAAPLSREQRRFYEVKEDGHAVQIVGYDADPNTGAVIKWKIKNSWGEASGDHGYYHMYTDYFRAFAKSITFYEDSGVPLPKVDQKIPVQLIFSF